MTGSVSFFVPGIPAPRGSKRGFIRGKHVSIVDTCKRSGDWMTTVGWYASGSMRAQCLPGLMTGPLSRLATFTMPRPKSHYKGGDPMRGLKDNAPHWCVTKPDAGKLARAIDDALTGVVWHDDSQVVDAHELKAYGEKCGVYIIVAPVGKLPSGSDAVYMCASCAKQIARETTSVS